MRVLIFGASGSAGASVLKVCLSEPSVTSVRAIVRRPLAVADTKLEQVQHADFLDYAAVAPAFEDVQLCLYCLGVSVSQVPDESAYRRITRDFAVAAAEALHASSPSALLHFISGEGTAADSRFMWARVKAEAEAALLGPHGAVCFRPSFIDGEGSATGVWYNGALRHFFRLFEPFRGLYVSGADLGRAMLQVAREGSRSRIIRNREIRDIADRWRSSHARPAAAAAAR